MPGTRLYLGVRTDRARCFSLVTGLSLDDLRKRGVTVINAAEPGLDILDSDPESLVVGGQNVRFEARLQGTAQEIGGFSHLPGEVRAALRKSSSNVLVMRTEAAQQLGLGVSRFGQTLRGKAAACWADEVQTARVVQVLVATCDFHVARRADRELIARHILYETYRAGEPTL